MSFLASMNQVRPMPTGVDRLGFATYRNLPAGVPNPPNAWAEANELNTVRTLNARANANPQAMQYTEYLDKHGATGIWKDFAKQYRSSTGLVRGWAGTAMMYAAIGSATLTAQRAKSHYDRLRPYQYDQSIRPIGKLPHDSSYPSGHASAAYAAATALSTLWPARAQEFMWWAKQVAVSRVHAGVHHPSDVNIGAQVGMRAGLAATSILR